MNDDNLIPFNDRTEIEQREIAKRGGKSSGAARRRKKSIKQMLNVILESKASCVPEELRALAAQMDIDTNDMLYAVSLFARALSDVQAAKYMDELLGRSPALTLKREDIKLNKARFELDKQRLTGRIEINDLIKLGDVGIE